MTKPLVLIIEDDPDLATIFSQVFKMTNFAVQVARDGQTAMKQLSQLTPNVIMLDLHLPTISGQDVLYHIRADKRLADTKVIVSSGDLRLAENLKDLIDLTLIKPIRPTQLAKLVSTLL